MLRRFSRVTAYGCVGIAMLALTVRATTQDAWPLSAWVYYFVPPPLIAMLLLAATLLFAAAAAKIPALVGLAAAMAVYSHWHFLHEFDRPCATAGNAMRVLAWNVARGRAGWDAIADYAKRTDADVIGLVEAGNSSEPRMKFWRERFDGYNVLLPGGGLVLLVRGDVVSSRFQKLVGISSALAADLEETNVAVTNIYPCFSRTPILDSPQYGYDERRSVPEHIISEPADVVAEMLRGIRRNRLHVFPDKQARRVHWLTRLVPWVIPMLNRRLRDESKIVGEGES